MRSNESDIRLSNIQEFCNRNSQYNITLIGVILGFDVVLGMGIISNSLTNSTSYLQSTGLGYALFSMVIGICSIIYYQTVSMNISQEYISCKFFSKEIGEDLIQKIIIRDKGLAYMSIYTVFLFFLAFFSFVFKDYQLIYIIISAILLILIYIYVDKNFTKNIFSTVDKTIIEKRLKEMEEESMKK